MGWFSKKEVNLDLTLGDLEKIQEQGYVGNANEEIKRINRELVNEAKDGYERILVLKRYIKSAVAGKIIEEHFRSMGFVANYYEHDNCISVKNYNDDE